MSDYGTLGEVAALTRVFLIGQGTYNSTTLPTGSEVTTYLNRAGAVLDLALGNQGFTTPVSQATAKLACDQWVVEQTVKMVSAYHQGPDPDSLWLTGMADNASQFVMDNAVGFKTLGVPVEDASSASLLFTAATVQSDRTDPDDTTLEQSLFTRRRFDNS